jgi:hypothetical protein
MNLMRLSLQKAAHATLIRASCRKSGHLARFSRDVGHHRPTPRTARRLQELAVNIGGIPHLAKNERAVGHPLICGGERFKPFAPWTKLQWFCFLSGNPGVWAPDFRFRERVRRAVLVALRPARRWYAAGTCGLPGCAQLSYRLLTTLHRPARRTCRHRGPGMRSSLR